MRKCPCCHEKLTKESILGRLGNLLWYRCRYCGAQSSRVIKRRK